MDPALIPTILVVAFALFFNFSNGFHDSSGQVATVISCGALAPETALVLAALADFVGAYYLGTSVAKTIGKDIVDPELVRSSGHGSSILLCALLGATLWNLGTWYWGLPSSSSHALIGGLIGAFLAGWGAGPIQWNNVTPILLVMLVSPLAGFLMTLVLTKLTFFVAQWFTPRVNQAFKRLQALAMVGQSLAHGTNDAQKSMGLILFALVLYRGSGAGLETVPEWVILSCALTMSLGIAAGGWRIIRTLGSGLYRVRPVHGFASQATSGTVLYLASLWGFPISSTQVASSSIMGAGAAFRVKSVRWDVAWDMLMAWLVTIPASAVLAAASYKTVEWTFF